METGSRLPQPRCPVCGARDGRPEGTWRRCGHCGLRTRSPTGDGEPAAEAVAACARQAIDALLRPGIVDLAGVPDAPLAMDAYTLRTAASARGLTFEPVGPAQADALASPHSTLPARGRLAPFAPAPRRVTLGVICRAAEIGAAFALVDAWRDRFAGAVVAVDDPSDGSDDPPGAPPGYVGAPPPPPTVRADGTRVLHRALDGDFAAQRNAVQALAPSPWVLQLDADESPDPGLLDAMDALAAQADRHGLVSIGCPRRNLVDGALSDLWPDVQYRLNRREVRYAGRVHERPDLGGRWQVSMIAPAATLAHRLRRARVLERSVRYEAMRGGAGRPSDEAALLRPFRA